VVPYLVLGLLFVAVASLAYRRGGAPLLILSGLGTTAALLAVGLTQHAKYPSDETVQVPILFALVPPAISGAVIYFLARADSRIAVQWFVGALAWGTAMLVTGMVALYLNWITI
jgi:hypothetical protein